MTGLAGQPEREVGFVAIRKRLLRCGVHRDVVLNFLVCSRLLRARTESQHQ